MCCKLELIVVNFSIPTNVFIGKHIYHSDNKYNLAALNIVHDMSISLKLHALFMTFFFNIPLADTF